MSLNTVRIIDGQTPPKYILMSVSDKDGLEELVPFIFQNVSSPTIISTGGTAKRVQEIFKVKKVESPSLVLAADYTGQPETQGGLVKTLDFKIYLGLLTETRNNEHQADLKRTGALPINLVVVNLYPFKSVIAKEDVTFEMARGNVDIGGPCMIRAAAKNFHRVCVVTDPSDYPELMDDIRANGGNTSLPFRIKMMKKAFEHTAAYDQAIANYMAKQTPEAIAEHYDVIW